MARGKARKRSNEKFGTLIEGLRADYSIVGAYWNLLTLIRWTTTIIILIFLKDHNEFQILLLLMISLLFSAFLIQGRPFKDSLSNKMSLFTEIIVSIYLYILLCLTDFTATVSTFKDQLALALVCIIGLTVIVNLIVLVKKGFIKCKKYILKKLKSKD